MKSGHGQLWYSSANQLRTWMQIHLYLFIAWKCKFHLLMKVVSIAYPGKHIGWNYVSIPCLEYLWKCLFILKLFKIHKSYRKSHRGSLCPFLIFFPSDNIFKIVIHCQNTKVHIGVILGAQRRLIHISCQFSHEPCLHALLKMHWCHVTEGYRKIH